jgi:hypothetical protein
MTANARHSGLPAAAAGWAPSFTSFRQLPTGPGSIKALMSTFVISIGNNPTSSDFQRLNMLRLTLPHRALTSFTALLKLSQLLLASAY